MIAIRSVYLAGRIRRRDELNAYREELQAAGIEVTSRWLTMPTPSEWSDDTWAELAQIDREDVLRADGLVLFTEPERDGGSGRVARIAGLTRAKDMVMLGKRIPADQAKDWGLVTETAADADALMASLAEIRRIERAGATVVCGHDLAQWATLKRGAAAYD